MQADNRQKEPDWETRIPGKASQLQDSLWAPGARLKDGVFQQMLPPLPSPADPTSQAGPSEPTT